MCAINGFIHAHGFGGRPVGRLQPVKGEPRKAVTDGLRGKELKRPEGKRSTTGEEEVYI